MAIITINYLFSRYSDLSGPEGPEMTKDALHTATDTAFAPPFGTIRQCRCCGCLVAGGPTACVRCAKAGE